MSHSWEFVIEALRNELQEYGALLSLFEEQQANLFQRDPDRVAALALSIEEQVHHTHECRERRELRVRDFVSERGGAADLTLRQLGPLFPPDVQPLLEALVGEINRVIHRIRRDARQNHLLLARTVEAHEEALRVLAPGAFKERTYSPCGAVAAPAVTSGWQAAG